MTYMADSNKPRDRLDEVVAGLVKELPSRIAMERKRSNLTVTAAAAKAGLDAGYWRKLERGGAVPGIENLLLVQYALGLESLEPLFGVPSGRLLAA
jgi:transcriptional regulator with XRE-family HTH domain